MQNTTDHEVNATALPLDLTRAAAHQFPAALELAYALEADRAAWEPVRSYLVEKNHVSQERAELQIREYLKYMVLVAVTNRKLAPSEDADAAWHAHILHTQLYGSWCEKHFRRFMHHVPTSSNEHPAAAFLKKQNRLGELFFGSKTIYGGADCANSHCHHCHSCHTCTVHIETSGGKHF